MAVKQIQTTQEYDEVLKNNPSVFVDFFATWCGPCKMVGPVVDKVSEEESGVTFVKVDVDQLPEVAQRYGVMSIPTLLAIKNGQVADQIVGFVPEPKVKALAAKAK